MAQAIRRDALPVVLDVDMQREWLERLPELQRELEEARALREVAGLEDKAAALLFLLAWPDLEAAERLVMEHHDAMVGQSCGTFNEAARRLEATAPRAAMLLYRRAAFCVFSTGPGLIDRKPRNAQGGDGGRARQKEQNKVKTLEVEASPVRPGAAEIADAQNADDRPADCRGSCHRGRLWRRVLPFLGLAGAQ